MRKRLYLSFTAIVLCCAILAGSLGGAVAENSAPIAENFEFETFRGVSFGGKLAAHDPDGDVLSFEITTEPRKGSIELFDDGSFIYTPAAGKKGRDYFGYKAVDPDGRHSQEATVIIRLLKCDTDVAYVDMVGSACERNAIMLAECGLFVGKSMCGDFYFEPQHSVSKGEFLSMCLKATGAELLSGVVSTGFTDDADIAPVLKPYVATALLNGVISGKLSDGSSVFDADKEISKAEAMVILDQALRLSDVSYIDVDKNVPEWAVQSAANLSACNIISETGECSDALTRTECADMLVGAMELISKR